MKMINVLQRLAELDSQNPNVIPVKAALNPHETVEAIQKNLSEELSSESLKYLAGVKNTIAECGMMPPPPMTPPTPASFSINATAATGDEVAGMLTQIMNLAGVKPVGPSDMPIDKPAKPFSTVPPMGGDMKKMLDTMNKTDSDDSLKVGDDTPEEGALGTLAGLGIGGALGGLPGAGVGALAGDAIGDMLSGDEETKESDTESDSGNDVDIAGVGGALAGAAIHGDAEGAEKGMQDGEDESMTGANEEMRKLIDAVSGPDVDNKPADPTEVPSYEDDKHAYDPNTGDHRERQAGLARANPMEDTTAKLFSDYEKFIAEGKKAKCNHTPKGKECPVHGLKECGM